MEASDESTWVKTDESEFVRWAEAELRRAGLFDEDSDYGGMLGESVMRLVREFSDAGHSGASAMVVAAIFEQLVARKSLTPLTSDPAEWMHIDAGAAGTWQSRRQPSCFSSDGGRTYIDISERQALWRRVAERVAHELRVYRGWALSKRHVAAKP